MIHITETCHKQNLTLTKYIKHQCEIISHGAHCAVLPSYGTACFLFRQVRGQEKCIRIRACLNSVTQNEGTCVTDCSQESPGPSHAGLARQGFSTCKISVEMRKMNKNRGRGQQKAWTATKGISASMNRPYGALLA